MKTIRKGDRGLEVEILQKLLQYRGAEIEADKKFGKGTEKAVIDFQEKSFDEKGHALTPDGIVGPSTWRSLLESDDVPLKPVIAVPVDKVTSTRIDTIHPELKEELREIYDDIRQRGVSVRFTQVYRTFEQQAALYAKGRTLPGKKVTNAKPGQSYHNYGLAVDIGLLLANGKVSWDMKRDEDRDSIKDWDEVVYVFKEYGWDWGGNWTSFKDYPHFEKSFGLKTSELKSRYDAGDFVSGNYVRLS